MRPDHHRDRELWDATKEAIDDPARFPIRFGVVNDVDPAGFVKVEIQPEGDLTDWLPFSALGIGMGPWRARVLPPVGTEVKLEAKDPEHAGYTAYGLDWNPQGNPGGEAAITDYAPGTVLLEHTSGARLLLDANGMIYLGGKDGALPLVLQSWITDVFNAHTHPHPFGPTSTPTVPWTAGDVSTKVKGV
jgi:hypothetical protein